VVGAVGVGTGSASLMRVPSGATPHALSAKHRISTTRSRFWKSGKKREMNGKEVNLEYILDYLVPIRLMVKLVLIVSAKVRVKLFAGHELEQVRVEAHLVACDGIEEGRDALIEEGEDHGEVYDDRAAESLDVVILQDREHFACHGNGRIRAQRRALVVNDDHQ
jgi:hypothetical protein